MPFAARGRRLAAYDGHDYKPLFLAGVNLGVGLPGLNAGDLGATEAQYAQWFARMGEMGLNCVRLYTLHYPRCYEALAAYNLAHRDRPLYLIQGVWLDEEVPQGDLTRMSDPLDADSAEVVDALHGRRTIAQRFGRAYGTFTSDVSPWVIAWVVGREMYPSEVATTNVRHPDEIRFSGKALRLEHGTPTEAWLAGRLDHLITYEQGVYEVQRPVGFATWPTLDPLPHAQEVVPYSHEDAEVIDLANVIRVDAPAGVFPCFHAYPYYPNFMTEEMAYQGGRDAQGPNSYVAYLEALVRHYGDMPVMIGEFGTPSSWGNAHEGAGGMSHGGLDEAQQGAANARLLGNIHDADAAGGIAFSWIDEWWKRTWITDPLAFPPSRYLLWHNVTSPEQNFGLVAFEPPAPDYSAWSGAMGTGRVRRVQAVADAAFLHLAIELASPLTATETLTVGYDTHRADLGESVLPGGKTTNNRCEFALQVVGSDAQLFVTRAYNTLGIWHGTSAEDQFFRSIATNGQPWDRLRWQNGGEHRGATAAQLFPATYFDAGRLRVASGGAMTSLDAVQRKGNMVHVTLPWTYLNVTDPSAGMVLADDRATPAREAVNTDGVAFVVALGGEVLESTRYRWPSWETVPPTREREKASLPIFMRAVQALPDLR